MQGSVSILNVSPEAAAMIASGGRISTMDGTARFMRNHWPPGRKRMKS